jgi:hypothetical protein
MRQSEFEQHVGHENICESITKALLRAHVLHQQQEAVPTAV